MLNVGCCHACAGACCTAHRRWHARARTSAACKLRAQPARQPLPSPRALTVQLGILERHIKRYTQQASGRVNHTAAQTGSVVGILADDNHRVRCHE